MEQYSSPRPCRALIVEDEIVIALDLQDAMSEMGFSSCDLASSDQKARSLAMWVQPDVALVDVCLDGGREGIEAGRWLREVCEVPIVFVTGYDDPDTIQRIHEQVPGAPVLSKPEYRKGLAAAVDDAIEHRIAWAFEPLVPSPG
jgi:AmiR/NasT family two-component response regulator